MSNTENGKQYAFIAAISYLVYVLYNIVTRFVHIIRGYPITAINLLFWLILSGFCRLHVCLQSFLLNGTDTGISTVCQ